MPIKTIFLDMDGVTCNFVKATCAVLGLDYDNLVRTWPYGEYDFAKVTGIGYKEMWAAIDARGKAFWQEMEEYSWFKELHAELSKIAPVYFLTSPSWNPDCAEGKLHWLQDRFGEGYREYVLTHRKFLLSHEDTVLIDDNPEQVSEFYRKGHGNAILFPQPWNTQPLPAGKSHVEHILHSLSTM